MGMCAILNGMQRPYTHMYVDMYRYIYEYPVPDQEAVTVAKKITYKFFFHLSPTEQLHSDHGCNFESDVIAEICKLLVIVKT